MASELKTGRGWDDARTIGECGTCGGPVLDRRTKSDETSGLMWAGAVIHGHVKCGRCGRRPVVKNRIAMVMENVT